MWTWLRRLSYLARQSRHDEELRAEIEAHRRFRQAHLQHDGVPEAEAADASRRAMGNVVLAREKPLWEGEARKPSSRSSARSAPAGPGCRRCC